MKHALPLLLEAVVGRAHPGGAAEHATHRADHALDGVDLVLEGGAEVVELVGVGAVEVHRDSVGFGWGSGWALAVGAGKL